MPAMQALPEGFVRGFEGRVYIGATELPVLGWSGKHDFGSVDRTNSKSRGSKRVSRGIETFSGLSIECEVPRDPATGLAQCPPVTGGKTYPVQLQAEDGKGYAFPAYIQSVDPKNDIKGGMMYTLNGESNGDITPWDGVDLPEPADAPAPTP